MVFSVHYRFSGDSPFSVEVIKDDYGPCMANLILIDIAKHFQVGNGTCIDLGCRSIEADFVRELDFKMLGSNYEWLQWTQLIGKIFEFRLLVCIIHSNRL